MQGLRAQLAKMEEPEEIYQLYMNKSQELHRQLKKDFNHTKIECEMLDLQHTIMVQKAARAQEILNKYELMTREYQSQNKMLKERHEMIVQQEKEKRKQIIENFENHISGIRQKMEEDKAAMQDSEIVKDNDMLRKQYEELMKEIDEKEGLMKNELDKKAEASQGIEEKMAQKIQDQEKEILEQIKIYEEQTTIKKNEEKELLKVLNDYKSKY